MSRYESHNLEYSELPFIYRSFEICASDYKFGSSNWHENVELLYVTEGEGAIVNNGKIISVLKGDLVIINSNHLHAMAAGKKAMRYRCFIIDRTFCVANGIDTNAFSFESKVCDSRVRDLMESLEDAYQQSVESPCRTLAIRTRCLELLLFLSERYGAFSEQNGGAVRSVSYVKAAIDYIIASYSENFSLDDAAQFVGINRCYLSREFHKYTGYSFVTYVNRTRCKMARRMLANSDLSISEIGRRCGFENRSYFAKIFHKYVGMLPGAYRASVLKGYE